MLKAVPERRPQRNQCWHFSMRLALERVNDRHHPVCFHFSAKNANIAMFKKLGASLPLWRICGPFHRYLRSVVKLYIFTSLVGSKKNMRNKQIVKHNKTWYQRNKQIPPNVECSFNKYHPSFVSRFKRLTTWICCSDTWKRKKTKWSLFLVSEPSQPGPQVELWA